MKLPFIIYRQVKVVGEICDQSSENVLEQIAEQTLVKQNA